MPSGRRVALVAVLVAASAGLGGLATASPSPATPAASPVTPAASPATPTHSPATTGAASTTPADQPTGDRSARRAAGGTATQQDNESVCSFDHPSWRAPQLLAGVRIQGEQVCRPDDPNVVAASVLGTNNVPDGVLERSGLARDAVVKRNDTDGDGDPDAVHVTLEVMGINEHNPALTREIAPGVSPAFWVFAPKTRGMVTDGSPSARVVRMPSPPIRVEAGDRVTVTLENTHYLPHTFRVHGADSSLAVTASGSDGAPQTGGQPVPPGEQRTYEFTPTRPGTYFYGGGVGPGVQDRMGLSGLFVVVENRSDNRVQTLNVGGGKVRHPSAATAENHTAVFDLQYQAIDAELHRIPKRYDDVRRVAKATNREYDPTNASMDYFLLNGRSFPYTLRKSILPVEANESYRLRVLNAGGTAVSLHTHGHTVTVGALDGVSVPNGTERTRDVLSLAAAQRADVVLDTTTDDSDADGGGVWLLHDHRGAAGTNDGIAPGGSLSMIAYESALAANGVPEVSTDLARYFNESYYGGEVPVWGHLDREAFGEPPADGSGNDGTDSQNGSDGRSGFGLSAPALFGLSALGGALLAGFGVALGRWSR